MEKYVTGEDISSKSEDVELLVCEKFVNSELSGDFSLSDYQPEIKRLLRVTAQMLPPAKYIGPSNAEFTGNIDYYVLYMGVDNEVYCAPLSGEYNVSIPVERDNYTGDELTPIIIMTPDMISGRVTSPRHITIKCRLKTHAKFYGNDKVTTSVTRCNGTVEKLKKTVKSLNVYHGVGDVVSLNDEIIPDARDGEFRVVCADGNVLINEVSSGRDEVICRGEVNLKLMTSREDGSLPSVNLRRIPFSSIVPCAGACPESSVYAKGCISELTITVDEGRISAEVGVIPEAVCQQNSETEYISDIYSTSNTCNCEYRDIVLAEGIMGFNRNFTFGESMALSDTQISPASQVADVCGVACVEECDFDNGKFKMTGRCKFNLQLFDGADYSVSEIEMPFKYESEMPEAQGQNCDCEVHPSVVFCRARVDGERVGIDAEISLCGRVWENKKIRVLSDFSQGERLEGNAGDMIVCYPKKSDTLWDVAKRYSAQISELCKNNKLPTNISADKILLCDCADYVVI